MFFILRLISNIVLACRVRPTSLFNKVNSSCPAIIYYYLIFSRILPYTVSIAVGRAFVAHMKTIKSGMHDFLNSHSCEDFTFQS